MALSAQLTSFLGSYAQKLATKSSTELPEVASIISTLHLREHPEGGYFVETDRDTTKIPNPFIKGGPDNGVISNYDDLTRDTSTSIFYLLSPTSPIGAFHRNKGRTIHTLHRGRGCYVVIHADEEETKPESKARIEVFTVGQDIAHGEKLQWIVEGGKYKASFLLPDEDQQESSGGMLISETVTPGFEFSDHDFMTATGLNEKVASEQVRGLSWLLRPHLTSR
jgi:uncharacterized protein